jgi:hypothetical protein
MIEKVKILIDKIKNLYGSLDSSNAYQSKILDMLNFNGILTSDGWRYLKLSERSVPKPYNYRWIIPQIAKRDRRKWSAISAISSILMIPGMKLLTGKWSSGFFMFGLSGIWPFAKKYPVLVDPPAMCSAIFAAAFVKRKQWFLATLFSLFSGASKEVGPIFASLYAWHPLPLVGLASPAVRHFVDEGEDITDDYSHEILIHPFENAWISRKDRLYDPKLWIYPWGVCLIGFLNGDRRTILTLLAAYGQCIRANDTIRLYQWAWPVLAENTVNTLPEKYIPAGLLLHYFNPHKGDGG